MILEGDVFLIRDKAVSGWILDFVDDTITLEKEYKKGPPSHGESKSNDFQGDGYVSEDRENSMVDEELNIPINQSNFGHAKLFNDDPFGLDELLSKKNVSFSSHSEPSHPLGFTPSSSNNK